MNNETRRRQIVMLLLPIAAYVLAVTALGLREGGPLCAPPLLDNIYRPAWVFRNTAPPAAGYDVLPATNALSAYIEPPSLGACGAFTAAWGSYTVDLPAGCDPAAVQIWCASGSEALRQNIVSDLVLDPAAGQAHFTLAQDSLCGFYTPVTAP